MNSFQYFNGKSYAVVGPKRSKQWKSLRESDISRFLCFFECSEFREMWESHEISKSIQRYPQRQNSDLHCHATVDMWKSRFFKNRSGAYIVSISELFEVAQRGKRDAQGGSSGALWNVWAMPKTFDFVTIQARERLRQDGKWTCIFM